MVITARCTHKIALVDSSGVDVSHFLIKELLTQGISSRTVEDGFLSTDEPIDSTVLFIRMREFSRASLQRLLHEIPELAGILAVYPSSVRTYQVLKDTATARSERVAMVGALFFEEKGGHEGHRICSEVGIPYIGAGSLEVLSGDIKSLEISSLVRLVSG
ncbi:MAG: hypothetical protein JXK93_08330 [Sphaerochaetaceae bacterium]|nr:hypothetical protein [Sphaerochaetaceae bacterium]